MIRRRQFIAKWGMSEKTVIDSILNLPFPIGDLFGPELANFVKDQAAAAKDSKDLLQAWGLNQKKAQGKGEGRFGGSWAKKPNKGRGKKGSGHKFPKKGNTPSSSKGGKGGGEMTRPQLVTSERWEQLRGRVSCSPVSWSGLCTQRAQRLGDPFKRVRPGNRETTSDKTLLEVNPRLNSKRYLGSPYRSRGTGSSQRSTALHLSVSLCRHCHLRWATRGNLGQCFECREAQSYKGRSESGMGKSESGMGRSEQSRSGSEQSRSGSEQSRSESEQSRLHFESSSELTSCIGNEKATVSQSKLFIEPRRVEGAAPPARSVSTSVDPSGRVTSNSVTRSSSGSKAVSFCRPLELDYDRSLGSEYPVFRTSVGISVKQRSADLGLQSYSGSIRQGESKSVGRGGSSLTEQGCDQDSFPGSNRLLFHVFSSPETYRGLETHIKPESVESVHDPQNFQDGNPSEGPFMLETRSLGSFCGPERCLSSSSSPRDSSEMAAVPVSRN